MENNKNIAAGMTDQQLMSQNENIPPPDVLLNASEGSILHNRMEALLAGLNDNSNSSFKNINENSTSMDGQQQVIQ